jgi:hypothetical protein
VRLNQRSSCSNSFQVMSRALLRPGTDQVAAQQRIRRLCHYRPNALQQHARVQKRAFGSRIGWLHVAEAITYRSIIAVAMLRDGEKAVAPQVQQHAAYRSQIYSTSSSALTRSVLGTDKPSALTVFMLITRSNFVGCWTGSSAGLEPLRMRSA